MSIKNALLGAIVSGLVVTGGVAVDVVSAPRAEAAACWGQITPTKGKNYTGCGRAQHFNLLSSGKYAWGNKVGANTWSQQVVCYPNVSKYGMVRV